MFINRVLLMFAILGSLVILGTGVAGQPSVIGAPSPAHSIVGSWMVTPTAAGRSAAPLLLTFTSDGNVLRSTALGGRSAGHGVWISNGGRTVTYTAIFLRYNTGWDFVGTTKDRVKVTLDATFDEFAGSGKFDLFDAQGKMGRSVDFTLRGTRIKVESP